MKKRFLQAVIAAALISSMVVTPVFANPSVDDMKKDKENAESEVTSLQSELTDILDKISTLEQDLKDKQSEIDQANVDLEEAIVRQNRQYQDMKKRIQYMYESGNGNELDLLLSADSFSDLVNKAEYIKNVHDYDRKKQEEYAETTQKIEDLSSSLQKEADSLTKMQTQLQSDKSSLNSMIEGKQSEIAKLDADIQEAVAAQQAAEEEARRQAEAQAAAQAQAQAQSQSQASSQTQTPSAPSGGSAGGSTGSHSSSGGGSASVVPPQGQDGWAVVAYARQFLGNPYVYGGNSLTNGIDCSGFTQQIYAAFGVSLGRTDAAQASAGVEVPLSQARAGDLLVYYGHVGIYNGSGGIIHASSPEVGIVEWPSCTYRQLRCVRRVL